MAFETYDTLKYRKSNSGYKRCECCKYGFYKHVEGRKNQALHCKYFGENEVQRVSPFYVCNGYK